MSPRFGLWLAGAVLGLSSVAHADPVGPEPVALRWTRTENAQSCPDATTMARAVEHRLGRPLLVPLDQATFVVDASVAPRPLGGFAMAIALTRDGVPKGHRELESSEGTCGQLAEEAALVIALMIDPTAALAAGPAIEEPDVPAPPPHGEPEASPAPDPEIASRIEPAAVSPAEAPRPGSWGADLGLGVAVAGGLLPGVAPGVLVRGRALPPNWPIAFELEGAYFPPADAEASAGKGAHFQLLYAGFNLCNRPRRGARVGFSACGGGQAGAVAGQGYGFDSTPTFQKLYAALAVRGDLWVRPLPTFALVMGPALGLPLTRDHFETTEPGGTTELFRVSAVTFAFQAGAVWEW